MMYSNAILQYEVLQLLLIFWINQGPYNQGLEMEK